MPRSVWAALGAALGLVVGVAVAVAEYRCREPAFRFDDQETASIVDNEPDENHPGFFAPER